MKASFTLYWHTLRYLKLRQIYSRFWLRVFKPRVDASPSPPLRAHKGLWVTAACRRQSLLSADTFFFLNRIGRLSEDGWVGDNKDKLWRYNQHYFDDLNAYCANTRSAWHKELLQRWVIENPPGVGDGWDSYPTSLRIVNWFKWHLSGAILPVACIQSLAVQTRWLAKRLESHLLGNHYFSNAKAMVFSGVFFSGSEANNWLAIGLDIIYRELEEQVLTDGGNFERSPMYHSIFLEDLLDLINLSQNYPRTINHERIQHWRCVAKRMLTWLALMCHPDGEVSFFNDSAIGIAPSPENLIAYANRLGLRSEELAEGITPSGSGLKVLSESGYVRYEARNLVALLDVAPIGPDYLPGHAHADTLSFELSLFGRRFIVNGGTSQYGNDSVRWYERSTSAHSTVVIDGENSSEVWGGFRVARRAYPAGLMIEEKSDSVVVRCEHNGYQRIHSSLVHRREWCFSEGVIKINDYVLGPSKSATAQFHLHPDVRVEQAECGGWSFSIAGCDQKIHVLVLEGTGSLESSFYSPEFGIRKTCTRVMVKLNNRRSSVKILYG